MTDESRYQVYRTLSPVDTFGDLVEALNKCPVQNDDLIEFIHIEFPCDGIQVTFMDGDGVRIEGF